MRTLSHVKRLTSLLPYMLSGVYVFLLPTQLAKHFWPSWSYVQGVRLDYLAPTVSLLDVFGCVVLAFFWRDFVHIISKIRPSVFYILGLLIALNTLFSLVPLLSLVAWGKVVLHVLVIYTLSRSKHMLFDALVVGLVCGALIQFILVIGQLHTQSSLQGVWYWLGERRLVLSLPDVAKVFVGGREYFRPYGTFSHPNTMAGYFALLYFFLNWSLPFLTREKVRLAALFGMMISPLIMLASFSKIVIFSFVVGVMITVWSGKDYEGCMVCRVARTLVLGLILVLFSIPMGDPLSAEKRMTLFGNALHVFANYPWWGTGLGAYTIAQSAIAVAPKLMPLHQPVHNVGMLALAEVGIGGLMLGVVFFRQIFAIFTKLQTETWAMLAVFGITGMFDHYWLTQPQTRNLLLVVLLFVWNTFSHKLTRHNNNS